jgi:Flp pilus assembly pilin Flp
MHNIRKALKNIWKDESAQGATEYILILVIIVGAVVLFGPKLRGALESKTKDLTDGMDSVTVK